MQLLYFILLLIAFVCFLASAIQVSALPIRLVSFGLAFWVAVSMIQSLEKI